MGKNSDTAPDRKFSISTLKKSIVKRKILRNKEVSKKEGRVKTNKDSKIVQAVNVESSLHKKFKYQICHSKLSSNKKLIQHFKEHGDSRKRYGKSTQCDTCPMVFPTQTKAIQHKHRAHPNIPNSFCQFCGKLFVLKNSLEEHLTKDHANQISQTSDSIKCDHCSATFSNAEALQYHVKSLHQQINYLLASDLYIPPSSTKIIRSNSSELFSAYYCHLCGVEYMIKNSLKKHLYEMHRPEERNTKPDDLIKCRTCEAIFFTKLAYEKHLVFHKPNDFYAANQEARMKVVSRVDQDFDISRVPLLQEINIMLKQMTKSNMLPPNNLGASNILTNPIKTEPEEDTLSGDLNKMNENKNETDPDKSSLPKNLDTGYIKIQKKDQNKTINSKICQTKNVSLGIKPSIKTSISKNLSTSDASTSSKEIDKSSKPITSICEKSESKIIIKNKTDATMEIVDSQNKVILLKKVVLKKKPKVKVKIENQ